MKQFTVTQAEAGQRLDKFLESISTRRRRVFSIK